MVFCRRFKGDFHPRGKPFSDGLLFFLAARGAAQNVRLFSLWNRNLLHLHVGTHLGPVVLEQLRFKLLHLAARRAHQILATAFPNRLQILLAHDAAIHHPDAPRLAVLALHHAQNRFHRRDIGAVAIEGLVAERKAFAVDDERDHHLLAVRTMIARIAAAHHRILFRRSFHVRARQVVEQHIELGSEQLAITLLEMPLQLRLVRQNPVQTAVQPRVVDLAFFDLQQIIQRRRWIPALLDRQLAARRAQPVDGQHRRHTRPRHIRRIVIHRLLEETIQRQALPQFPAQEAGAELARSLQPNSIHQHARHLRIIGRRLDMRRKQFQLLGFALLVEHLDRLQPTRLRRTVQLTQITQRPLTRTVRRSAPFPPATSRCDPCHPCCAGAAAKTFWPDFVMSRWRLQEGRSALHRLFRSW